jgi:hypothetical protein
MRDLTICKQIAAKMTGFGFENALHGATVTDVGAISPAVYVVRVDGICPSPVFALVINKGHVPVAANHVVDFRVGSDIYSGGAK